MNNFLKKLAITLVFSIMLLLVQLLLSAFQEVRAYEDSECLACHKDYGRSPETMPEDVPRLYIDQEQWEKSVHYEVVGLSCDDCHLDATPETHPEKGFEKLSCGECHDEVAESYYQTSHWTSEVSEGKKKPDCVDCHPPHTIRSKDNPASTVFKGKIKTICLPCHQEREPSTRLFNKLALFRISAHRKSDISSRFDPAECLNCHYTQAVGHGEDPSAEKHCGKCHTVEAKAAKLIFGPFHLDPSLKNQPLVFFVEVLNIFIVLAVLIAFIVWIVRSFLKLKTNKATLQS